VHTHGSEGDGPGSEAKPQLTFCCVGVSETSLAIVGPTAAPQCRTHTRAPTSSGNTGSGGSVGGFLCTMVVVILECGRL
jgi:hypothetical protein